eukprot:11193221-Lingulodinium_polyedra.AAC.1
MCHVARMCNLDSILKRSVPGCRLGTVRRHRSPNVAGLPIRRTYPDSHPGLWQDGIVGIQPPRGLGSSSGSPRLQ